MGKFRTIRPKERPDPEAVLLGHVVPSFEVLLDMVHAVNPTGLWMGREDRLRRYVLKSRLQSLVVRRFPDRLRVSREGCRDGFVRLDFAGTERNACHARIDELEDDIRSLVRRALDRVSRVSTEEGERSVPAPTSRPPTPERPAPQQEDRLDTLEDFLRAGQEALADFDYDAARRLLSKALCQSDGAPRPARLLLALLVDHLGDDAAALVLRDHLDAAALGDPEVRCLLSLAAARTGDGPAARALLKGVRRPQAAGVLLLLARHAAGRGELREAEALVGEASPLDPTHPELAEVLSLCARHRAAERAPFEEDLVRWYEAGDLAAAEQEAKEVLRLFPDSATAGRILRASRRRRVEAEAEALQARAEEAYGRGALPSALALLAQALQTGISGPARERIAARHAVIDREDRRAKEEEDVSRTVALLAAPDSLAEGLLSYLDLLPLQRERVRRRAPDLSPLCWLDELAQARPDAPARSLADAVLALFRARQVAPEDPEQALSLVVPHRRHLAQVATGRDLLRGAQALMQARRTEAALARYRALLLSQEAAPLTKTEALDALNALDWRALPPTERHEAEGHRQDILEQLEVTHLRDRIQAAVETRRFFVARNLVDELGARYPEWGKAYAKYRELLEGCLKRLYLALIVEGAGPERELADVDLGPCALQGAQAWLTASGREVLFVRDTAHHQFLRWYSLEERRVVRRALIGFGDEMRPEKTVVEGEGLWMLGHQGEVMTIGVCSLYILRHHHGDFQQPDRIVEGPTVAPGGFVWLPFAAQRRGLRDDPFDVRVIDAAHPSRARRVGELLEVFPIIRDKTPSFMLGVRRRGLLSVHDVAGALVRELPFDPQLRVVAAAADPSGLGLVVLGVAHEADRQGHLSVHLHQLAPDGKARTPLRLPDTDSPSFFACVAVQSERLLFVRTRQIVDTEPAPGNGQHQVLAFRATEAGPLELLYQLPVSQSSTLCRDSSGKRAALLVQTEAGVEVVALGPTLPRIRGTLAAEPVRLDPFSSHPCSMWLGVRISHQQTESVELTRLRQGQRRAAARARWRCLLSEPERLVGLLHAMDEIMGVGEGQDLLLSLPPGSERPLVRLFGAHYLCFRQEWSEILVHLADVDPKALLPGPRIHLHHLRAMAYLWLESPVQALIETEAGQDFPERACMLRPMEELARPLPGPITEAQLGPGQPMIRRLYAAVIAADGHLACGEAEAALSIMDRSFVWRARELQSAARLALAHLSVQHVDELTRYRKALALVSYVDLVRDLRTLKRFNLPFPGHLLKNEALHEISTQARDWYNEEIVAKPRTDFTPAAEKEEGDQRRGRLRKE